VQRVPDHVEEVSRLYQDENGVERLPGKHLVERNVCLLHREVLCQGAGAIGFLRQLKVGTMDPAGMRAALTELTR